MNIGTAVKYFDKAFGKYIKTFHIHDNKSKL